MRKTSVTGFTLIELLMVISIVTLLAAIIIAALSGARGQASNVNKLELVRQDINALELYYSANGYYPLTNGYCSALPSPTCNESCLQVSVSNTCMWGSSVDAALDTLLRPYIVVPPNVKDKSITNTDEPANYFEGIGYICTQGSGSKCTSYALEWVESGKSANCGNGQALIGFSTIAANSDYIEGTNNDISQGAGNTYCLYTSDNTYNTTNQTTAYYWWLNGWL